MVAAPAANGSGHRSVGAGSKSPSPRGGCRKRHRSSPFDPLLPNPSPGEGVVKGAARQGLGIDHHFRILQPIENERPTEGLCLRHPPEGKEIPTRQTEVYTLAPPGNEQQVDPGTHFQPLRSRVFTACAVWTSGCPNLPFLGANGAGKSNLTRFGAPRGTFHLHLKECEFRFYHREESLYDRILI